MQDGIALTLASSLRHEETFKNYPPSIRISVSTEMTEKDLADAAKIIGGAVEAVMERHS